MAQIIERGRQRERPPDVLERTAQGRSHGFSSGDVEAIVAALAPNIVIHAGGVDGKVREIHGARNWAKGVVVFAQRGQTSRARRRKALPGR